MRHSYFGNHLGRSRKQARALYRQLIYALITRNRLETTRAKAKAIQKDIDGIINLAREDTLFNRRQVAHYFGNEKIIKRLFSDVGPVFKDQQSGFTRIIALGPRLADAAEMVVLELVKQPAIAGEVVGSKEQKESGEESKVVNKLISKTKTSKVSKGDKDNKKRDPEINN